MLGLRFACSVVPLLTLASDGSGFAPRAVTDIRLQGFILCQRQSLGSISRVLPRVVRLSMRLAVHGRHERFRAEPALAERFLFQCPFPLTCHRTPKE